MSRIPDEVVERIQTHLDGKLPEHVRDQVREEVTRHGRNLTVWECRPSFGGSSSDEWSRMPVAQFRLNADGGWTTYWADRNDKRLRYPDEKPTNDLSRLLWLLDEDPYCCIWG